MTAEARSLAGIRQLRLNVQPLPDMLEETDLTAENIRAAWRKKLLNNGFEVADDEELRS